jgi:hypothetical protein
MQDRKKTSQERGFFPFLIPKENKDKKIKPLKIINTIPVKRI